MWFLRIFLSSLLYISFGICEEPISTIVKQRDIYRLLNYVYQENHYKDLNDLVNSFKFEEWDQWSKPQFAKEFHKYFKEGIPRDQPFSLYNKTQLQHAITLFKTFYYAKDYKTFLKVAAWARNNVNPEIFSYAFIIAVVHSEHTKDTTLPPFYEISPYFYYNAETIRQAQKYKETNETKKEFIVDATYVDSDGEQALGYFSEDVGVNSNYFFNHVMMPFWMDEELKLAKSRGEYFFHYHWQLLARYNLELYSNAMDTITQLDLHERIKPGYLSSMMYPNGKPFPSRAEDVLTEKCGDGFNKTKESEKRLLEFVDLGYYNGQLQDNKTRHDNYEDLANLLMGSAQSPNLDFYGSYLGSAKKFLGCSTEGPPSALEHFATALRDRIFWPLHKRVMDFYDKLKDREGPYEPERLLFPGVKVDGVEVDNLTTYFDEFESDLGNAVHHTEEEFTKDSAKISALQKRLNHKPFNYTIRVFSGNSTEAVIKVFLGPKHTFEPGDRANFVELDRFHQNLNEGNNIIKRSSTDSNFFSDDRVMFRTFYKLLNEGVGGNWTYTGDDWPKHYWFPRRLLLPKGSKNGQAYQLYVTVNRFFHKVNPIEFMIDHSYEFNFPFDRPIKSVEDFRVPNSYFKDVLIYHHEEPHISSGRVTGKY